MRTEYWMLLIGSLLLLGVFVVVPAVAITSDITILNATHRSGNCTYLDPAKTHYECYLSYQDVTAKVQAVANGNRLIKFDTRRYKGGMFTEYGLAWQMPYQPGNLGFTIITYKTGAITKQLAIRDRCWFNLGANQVWCPAVTLMEGMSASTQEMWV